jgi:predicted metal-dependent enzyme (double-stranded beta helix superfamily)
MLHDIVTHDDWLPESMGKSPQFGYVQNLIWCDPLERFSIVSFAWAPGARTPIHDHQVWGLVGMMRGSESSQRFVRAADGMLERGICSTLMPGDVEELLPSKGDIHQVSNVLSDRGSLSIHVYGGNIGVTRRHTFDPQTGEPRLFVSGYSNREVPNLWDYSIDVRTPEVRS